MKIAIVSPGEIPCVGYGGAERQVQWLAIELARRGHHVTVIAERAGTLPGIEIRAANSPDEVRAALPDNVAIVHFHARWPRSRDGLSKPFLNTAHNLLRGIRPEDADWSFVSAFHAQWQGGTVVVHNGFPTEEYPLCERKSRRLLFMAGVGRPGKNITRALRLARRYNFELDVAGGRRWGLLNRSKVRREGAFFLSLGLRFHFHGVVDGTEKMRLLGEARAFLNPIRVEETFGMAPVEAMLCGTPVLATPLAAMPEIVTPETGFLFETDEQFVDALSRIDTLAPWKVRESAVERFSITRTTDEYLVLYQRFLDGEPLEKAPPGSGTFLDGA